MALKVQKPGLATTVQDLGRPGYYDVGIPLSGAMDRFALRCANLLVGNDEGAAALECVFIGPELLFEADTTVAITGADLPPKLDGVAQPTWTAVAVKAGQVLAFDYLRQGARAYLAVVGGIDVPVVLGSRSTYALGALGGFEGRPLKAGDTLPLGTPGAAATPGRSIPTDLRRGAVPTTTLRVIPGLYNHRVTTEATERFFHDTWTVAPEADRIGYRFRGGFKLDFVERTPPFGAGSDPSNIVDSCYPYGSIQVPGGHRADRPAPRRGVGRRLLHDRHGDFGRHGFHRPAAAPRQGEVRYRRHGGGARSAPGAKRHAGSRTEELSPTGLPAPNRDRRSSGTNRKPAVRDGFSRHGVVRAPATEHKVA